MRSKQRYARFARGYVRIDGGKNITNLEVVSFVLVRRQVSAGESDVVCKPSRVAIYVVAICEFVNRGLRVDAIACACFVVRTGVHRASEVIAVLIELQDC